MGDYGPVRKLASAHGPHIRRSMLAFPGATHRSYGPYIEAAGSAPSPASHPVVDMALPGWRGFPRPQAVVCGSGQRAGAYVLHGIWIWWHNGLVDVNFPAEFGVWLDRLEAAAREGDAHARITLVFVVRALNQLRGLAEAPAREEETAGLRWVRQSRRYELWRVSHAYHPQVAVRLICWFPPKSSTVVVALFAADKAHLGDVFYDGVATRADPLIDQWKRELAS